MCAEEYKSSQKPLDGNQQLKNPEENELDKYIEDSWRVEDYWATVAIEFSNCQISTINTQNFCFNNFVECYCFILLFCISILI